MRKSAYVAIAGRPNAGKSTLLNAILRTKVSIVTDKAQTTREKVLGILTEEQGQIVFTDTPGIHKAKEGGINAFMMKEAEEALHGTNLVWYIVDPGSELKHEMAVLNLLKKAQAPIFVLMNKSDLSKGKGVRAREFVDKFEAEILTAAKELELDVKASFRLSAEKMTGTEELMDATWKALPEGEFFYPDEEQLSDRPTRFFVAEKIREQLLLQLGEELPYSCAVQIEKFEEKKKPPRIEAVIYVERDSQKGMVIGAKGVKIKAIGVAARAEIEEFLGHQIFLGLQVKVLKEWTRNAESLKLLGYNLPKTNKKHSA